MKRLFLVLILCVAPAFAATTVGGHFGAATIEDLEEAIEIAVQKDVEAWAYLIKTGRIVEIPAGKTCTVTDRTFSLRQIRIKGTVQRLWVPLEAVKE